MKTMNILGLSKTILHRCHSLFIDHKTNLFIQHNRQVWSENNDCHEEGEILLEVNMGQSAIISYSYLANILAQKHNAKIIGYTTHRKATKNVFVRVLRALVYRGVKKTYSSFGVTAFVEVNPNRQQIAKAVRLFEQIYPLLKSKRDVEELVVDGVWVGDLIYDTFLRTYSVSTIDMQSEIFIRFMHESLEMFIFWQDYFETHHVKAINVSHCVYNNAIPLRIAIKKGIAAYQTNATHVYRMSEKDMFAYGDNKYFPDAFAQLSLHEQQAGLEEAKRRIDLRFAGQVGVDMAYSTKSAYGKKIGQPVLRQSSRKKILIAAHCFFDSPHSYGNNLFPDFYEWFDFLGKISNETDYDWYIKTHPDFLPGNSEIIDYFIKKYPKFTLIDASTSHHQLIDEGISCALTTYGTIGFEYAALGVLVVNASDCNPHIAYGFNLHPTSVKAYEDIVRNLDGQLLQINQSEVYEYYYMKFIYNSDNWMFEDYEKTIDELGGYKEQFTSNVYEVWLREWTEEKHRDIGETMSRFIDSGDFRLNNSHMDKV